MHIAVRDSGLLVSHAAIVPRRLYIGEDVFSGGYVESVATLPDRQCQGLGSMAMGEANSVIADQFEVGALSTSSKDFYRKFGWEDWQGPSYVLTNNDWVRSESEDDGIMVLFSTSARRIFEGCLATRATQDLVNRWFHINQIDNACNRGGDSNNSKPTANRQS